MGLVNWRSSSRDSGNSVYENSLSVAVALVVLRPERALVTGRCEDLRAR
jgi:hypothetical protein